MRRGAKPAKAKVKAKLPVAPKSPKNEGSRVGDLEKRLAEALDQLQTRNRELAEAQDQQTATAEILRVISSSPTDAQPVFEAIVRSGSQLCDGADCIAVRFDGESMHLMARHNPKPGTRESVAARFPRRPSREGTSTDRSILDRRIVHLADVLEDPTFDQRAARAGQLRSVLSVPLMRGGNVVGTISISRATPGLFSDRQVALLQTFADQAVIAIENVRLFNETKEALEQQTATSEILGVISSSPTDVQPVFDTIAQSARRLCEAQFCQLFQFDGELLHFAANHGLTPEGVDAVRQGYPMAPGRGSAAARCVLSGAVEHIPDVHADLEYRHGAIAKVVTSRSNLAVPMLRDGVPIGAVVVARSQAGPFTDKQIALLRTFADQAVIAIENVRLFTELQTRNRDLTEALEQQTATSEVLRVISGSPTDVQPVFDTIVRSAVRLCDALFGTVLRFDGQRIYLVSHHNLGPDGLQAYQNVYPMAISRDTVAGNAILDRRITQVIDSQDESTVPWRSAAMARAVGFRGILVVPMFRDGEPIGVINVARREPGPFSDRQIELLKTFADQAVIAIENVRLFTELQEKNRALTEAHTRVTEALERQTATADILRIISRSQTDVQPVFDTIADSALRLLQGWSALILLYDGELLHFGAARGGLPDSERYQRERFPMRLGPDHLLARCVLERAPQQDPDALAHPNPTFRDLARRRGFAAFLTVPMLRGGEAIGEVVVTRAKAGPFEESAIALLQTFADQAVIAIENARLLSELQARTTELTRSVQELHALGEVSQALSSTLDLETVLNTIVTRANQLAGTDSCTVYEYDERAEEFHMRATNNLDEEVVAVARHTPIRRGEGVAGRMAVTRQPFQIPDIAMEGAYRGPLRDVLLRTGTRALLSVPLLREDHLVGGLTVNRKTPGEFAPETIDLLKTFATQSALAIQNARLFREIADKSRQLEAASRHKSEFLANMSHELRTPLNAIIGFSEVLTERMFGELNEKQDEYLKDIYASGQHLLSLINDILDLSKIEAGRMELELTDFDLPQAISNALTLVRGRAGRRDIVLHQLVDQRLGQIRGDERKIKQVLLNLLSNALKFTPEGGRVDVRAGIVDGMTEVSVTDTGVGIAPEDQEAVFEEFRQVGTADKKVEGTGLGLALSRKFIELHGGRIWVKSQVGVGSTFTFTLPLRRG